MCSWNYALLSNDKENLDFHKIFGKDGWNGIQVLLKNERNGIHVLLKNERNGVQVLLKNERNGIQVLLMKRGEKVPVFKPCTFYFPLHVV